MVAPPPSWEGPYLHMLGFRDNQAGVDGGVGLKEAAEILRSSCDHQFNKQVGQNKSVEVLAGGSPVQTMNQVRSKWERRGHRIPKGKRSGLAANDPWNGGAAW